MYDLKNRIRIVCILWIIGSSSIFSQDTEALFHLLKQKDSLIFNHGFNNCDTVILRKLLSDDFEFYHDQNGLLESKEIFIKNIPNLCNMNYRPSRKLLEDSLEIFPLYSNETLYGAVQTGTHEFYGEEDGQPKYLTSTATFTHVWVLESANWKLKRILSYNHILPDN